MQGISKGKPTATDLATLYADVRSYTEKLCVPLETEDYIPQPSVDVSPAKWNIAHTTWFFEEMILKRFADNYKAFDPQFGFLFNSYYNSIGSRTQRDNRGDLSRPTVKQVFAYRKYVDEQMAQLLSSTSEIDQKNIDVKEPNPKSKYQYPKLRDLVILGVNHEQQHQELFLTDLKYTFGLNPLFPVYRQDFAIEVETESANSKFIDIEGGMYEIGHAGGGFCFDNELSRHKVYLDDFSISDRCVTNAEFGKFIDAGGYRDFRYWHSEGWDWVNQNEIDSPLYWHKKDNEWSQFTLGGLVDLSPDAPVCHVSYYEASAFAEWKGMRLPTEFEWEAANTKFDWGKRWEWTNSAYLAYPGFQKAPGAVGEYNGKFMINQMVLRGASVATSPGHSRPTYRNFFNPNLRWQFTGIRLAK